MEVSTIEAGRPVERRSCSSRVTMYEEAAEAPVLSLELPVERREAPVSRRPVSRRVEPVSRRVEPVWRRVEPVSSLGLLEPSSRRPPPWLRRSS